MRIIFISLLFWSWTLSAFATEASTEEPVVFDSVQSVETASREKSVVCSPQLDDFKLVGKSFAPGSRSIIRWSMIQASGALTISTPITVIHGEKSGPVLGLTAAVHGDELNGIEIIRQVVAELDPKKLCGTVVAIPVVNVEGFWRRERYMGDRRDLNRYFPGSATGSYPSRIAHRLFSEIIVHCDELIDLHTGSFFRENLPQLRVDFSQEKIAAVANNFGGIAVLQSRAPEGSLRSAAAAVGIPAVVMEIGGPLSLEEDMVAEGVASIQAFLESVGMVKKISFWPKSTPIFYESTWIRADVGGILLNRAGLGDRVEKGDLLAEIVDPVTNTSDEVRSPLTGTILGRAQNQFVGPGFALFHIGIEQSQEVLEKQSKQVVEQKNDEVVEEL